MLSSATYYSSHYVIDCNQMVLLKVPVVLAFSFSLPVFYKIPCNTHFLCQVLRQVLHAIHVFDPWFMVKEPAMQTPDGPGSNLFSGDY